MLRVVVAGAAAEIVVRSKREHENLLIQRMSRRTPADERMTLIER